MTSHSNGSHEWVAFPVASNRQCSRTYVPAVIVAADDVVVVVAVVGHDESYRELLADSWDAACAVDFAAMAADRD